MTNEYVVSSLIFIFSVLGILFISGCVSQQPEYSGGEQPNNLTTGGESGTSAGGQEELVAKCYRAATYKVVIETYAYHPAELTIRKGETVVWENAKPGITYTVISDSGSELDSGYLLPGQTYCHTFNEAGTFTYHCSLHPAARGAIIVE